MVPISAGMWDSARQCLVMCVDFGVWIGLVVLSVLRVTAEMPYLCDGPTAGSVSVIYFAV